jgi:hypothetical protein
LYSINFVYNSKWVVGSSRYTITRVLNAYAYRNSVSIIKARSITNFPKIIPVMFWGLYISGSW